MDGFLRRLQAAVDISEDEDFASEDVSEKLRDMPTDTGELQHRLLQALNRIKISTEKMEELRRESCQIEVELSSLRMKFKTSRELWLMAQQFDQSTIDALLEEQFNSHRSDPATTADCETGSNLTGNGDAGDPIYTQSLREQIQTLREFLRKYAEERDKCKLELQQMRKAGGGRPGWDGCLLENLPVTTDKESWLMDRSALEQRVEDLEGALCRQSEVMSKLAVRRYAESDILGILTGGEESHFQEKHQLEQELMLWLQSRRSGSMGGADGAVPSAGTDESAAEYAVDRVMEASCEPASPGAARLGDVCEANNLSTGASHSPSESLAKRLEEVQAENCAQEEALNALYQDVHSLRERNGELEQQIFSLDEQVSQLRLELLFAQDQFRLEREKNGELSEMLQRAQQRQEKLGRECASANDALRRLHWQMNTAPPALEVAPATVEFDPKSNMVSHPGMGSNSTFNTGGVHTRMQFTAPTGGTLLDAGGSGLGGKQYGVVLGRGMSTFFGVLRVVGKKRMMTSIIIFSVVIIMLLLQASLISTDAESSVSKMHSDFITCQAELKVLQAGCGRGHGRGA